MENNKNKKSVKFQGDTLNFCDFIQVFVFTPNHHLKEFQHSTPRRVFSTSEVLTSLPAAESEERDSEDV